MTSREKRTREDELFGAVVRRHRHERGLSQERLAEAAGLSQRYLSVLERGENSPTLNVIVDELDLDAEQNTQRRSPQNDSPGSTRKER